MYNQSVDITLKLKFIHDTHEWRTKTQYFLFLKLNAFQPFTFLKFKSSIFPKQ
jgi:hypothetical protein